MPKIRFSDLPRGLWQHLLKRVDERRIPLADLQRLQAWVKAEPHAPEGDWYKDFGSFKLCGSGEHPKTFLSKGMQPYGEENRVRRSATTLATLVLGVIAAHRLQPRHSE